MGKAWAVLVILCVAVGAAGARAAAGADRPSPGLRAVTPSVARRAFPPSETVKVKVVLTRLECLAESQWDRFSDSDEPLLMVTGFRHPGAETGNSGYYIFSDVDTGEQRAVPANLAKAVPPASGYVVRGTPGGVITAHAATEDLSMVTLNPGETVGFDVRIFEHDDANEADITGTIAGMTRDMAATLHQAPSVLGDFLGLLGDVVHGITEVVAALADALLGAGDDYVGGRTVALYRPIEAGAGPGAPIASGADLIDVNSLPEGVTEKFFFVDGGSDGLYAVVYQITKTVVRPPATTVVTGVPVGQGASGQGQAEEQVVQGQAVPQEGGATVRRVTPAPAEGDESAAAPASAPKSGEPIPMPLLGARIKTVSPEDFLGDYQLLVDGLPFRLHLGDANFWIEDMSGRRYPIRAFYRTEGRRCEFSAPVLVGRPGRPATARFTGYLLTHNRAALAGTVVIDGESYPWYAAKEKGDRLSALASSPVPAVGAARKP